MKTRLISAACLALVLLATVTAEEPPASCKPVEHYGVKGCEILRGQTCPSGYHKQVVDPPNPMMKGPSYLMCVADQPPAKEQKQDSKKKAL